SRAKFRCERGRSIAPPLSLRRGRDESVGVAVGVAKGADELALTVDRIDFGPGRAGNINGLEAAPGEHEAVAVAVVVGEQAGDLARVVDALGDGERRVGYVDRRIAVLVAKKTV